MQAAPFFSIIMDNTPDVFKVDQLSQDYRYVRVIRDANNVATDLTITESFWGFLETAGTSAAELLHKILARIEDNGLDISKCCGQVYDGAANMRGIAQRTILTWLSTTLSKMCQRLNSFMILLNCLHLLRA